MPTGEARFSWKSRSTSTNRGATRLTMSSVETEGSDKAPPVWRKKLAALLTDSLHQSARDGNTEPKRLQCRACPRNSGRSALVDHLGPRRRLEREEPGGEPPIPAHIRERIAGAVAR